LIPKDYISIPALAKILGVSRIAVYKKVKKGQIKGVKIGRNYVVSKIDINKHIDRSRYITIPQLARELGVSRVCIHQRVKRGLIEAKKVGRNFLIPQEYLQTARKEAENVSIPELARQMGVSRVAVFKRVKNGSIRAQMKGRKFVVRKTDAQMYTQGFIRMRKKKKDV
jgi:excisionase family DNA binding protein